LGHHQPTIITLTVARVESAKSTNRGSLTRIIQIITLAISELRVFAVAN